MKEITVIGEDSGVAGFLSGATRTREIYMTDVASMVVRVIAQADGDKITRLNIIDHGTSEGGKFGKDWVSMDSIEKFGSHLAKLQPHFDKNGIVHLQHCEMGQNEDLMRMFAIILNVAVYAGTGSHNPIYRFNFGDYVRCSPSGTVYHNVSRP